MAVAWCRLPVMLESYEQLTDYKGHELIEIFNELRRTYEPNPQWYLDELTRRRTDRALGLVDGLDRGAYRSWGRRFRYRRRARLAPPLGGSRLFQEANDRFVCTSPLGPRRERKVSAQLG
jgi:hypothetical protein